MASPTQLALPRRRSSLKLAPSRLEPLMNTQPHTVKQTPASISISARSSSVVAPAKDGGSAMLFSRAELRLPRTKPLSVRAYDVNAEFGMGNGRDPLGSRGSRLSSTGNVLPRRSPRFVSVRQAEAIRRSWCFSTPAISPPRLPALHNSSSGARSHRVLTAVPLPTHDAVVDDALPGPPGVGSTSNLSVDFVDSGSSAERGPAASWTDKTKYGREEACKNSPGPIPRLEDPTVGEANFLADYRGTEGESAQGKAEQGVGRGVDVAAPGAGDGLGNKRRTRSRRSHRRGGGGGHSSMSVTEFADKVAALAADVAGVLGIINNSRASKRNSSAPAI